MYKSTTNSKISGNSVHMKQSICLRDGALTDTIKGI